MPAAAVSGSPDREDFYWDGGYTGNPALAPLYLGTSATDVIVVGINPIERTTVPRTARGIIDRIDEISFNSTFMLELGAIAFVEQLVKSGTAQAPFKLLHVHGIGDDALGSFGASSKMNNEWSFLQHLHEIGRRAADRWLAENLAAVGRRSTVDLSGLVPQKDGSLTGPSFINQVQFQQPMAKSGVPDMKINDVRVNRRGIFTPDRRAIETPLVDGLERVGDRSCGA